MDKQDIAVIGSGIGGLAAAYYIIKEHPSWHVTIFEKGDNVGGLAVPVQIQGQMLEKYYHHIFTTDTYIIEMINDLGLQKDLQWYKDNRATLYKGNLYPFNGPIDLLKFKPVPIFDRLRLAFASFYLVKTRNWKKLEKFTAKDWMERFAGKKAYAIFWEPLLYGKFQERFKDITMSWLWSRIETRVNSKGMLGYMNGSFGILFDKLASFIHEHQGNILLQTTIEKVSGHNGKVAVHYANTEGKKTTRIFDKAIITTPSQIYTRFLEGLDESYINNVNAIDYISAQTIILTLKHQLTPYYWISVADLDNPALVVVEQSNLTNVYNGKHVTYLGNYLPNDSKILTMTDRQLQDMYYPFLKKLNRKFSPAWVEEFRVFRAPFAQPIVDAFYHTHIPETKSPVENIYILNMSQVYPEDRGMNFAIKNAYHLVHNMLA